MEELRETTNKLKMEFLEEMEHRLSQLLDKTTNSIDELQDSPKQLDLNQSSIYSPNILSVVGKKKSSIVGNLPEKIFSSRESPLTELLKVQHFKTIHHIFIATLSLFMIHALVIDILQTGTLDFGLDMLMWAFGKTQTVILLVLSMNIVAILVLYPSFHLWATWRQEMDPELRRKFDWTAGGSFVSFVFGFIFIPALMLWKNPLPPASGAAVTMEQCRLLMKMYAFIRTCAPRVLAETVQKFKNEKPEIQTHDGETQVSEHKYTDLRKRTAEMHSNGNAIVNRKMERRHRRESWINWNDEDSGCPGFSKYIYFLFVPTLIYKDNYPMKKNIKWDYVCWNIAQCVGCVIYANFILTRFGTTFFSKFGHPDHPMNLTQLTHALFSMMLPGTMCLFLAFFLILHAWQNAFAEILYFGDRLFYKDWWNSSSFARYYKTWNMIVYDWLYTYVFKDACEFGLGEIWRPLPTMIVFLISSLFHEYILCFSFNFFFPVLLSLFGGLGLVFVFLKRGTSAFGNVLMWMALISGSGIIVTLYTMEYYARIHCPPSENFDFFKPRSLTCGAFTVSLS